LAEEVFEKGLGFVPSSEDGEEEGEVFGGFGVGGVSAEELAEGGFGFGKLAELDEGGGEGVLGAGVGGVAAEGFAEEFGGGEGLVFVEEEER
jgi:hypothetical protein